MSTRILLLSLFLLAAHLVYSQPAVYEQIDKLYPNQRKPFILLNFSSRDCINCRSGISYILPETSKAVGDSNMVILIDHKNLSLYLKKYPELFGNYKTQVSQELSSQLSPDGKSRLFVVGKGRKAGFELNVLDNKVLKSIVDTFRNFSVNSSETAGADKMQKTGVIKRLSYSDTDTIFEQYESIFEATDNGCLVFSTQFQIGRVIDFNDAASQYFEFGINAATIDRLNNILARLYPMKYLPADSSQQILKYMTLPTTYIENVRFAGEKCYVAFKYNCVSFDGVKASGDDIGIRSRYFIGEISLKDKLINVLCDLSNYNAFYLVDTLIESGQVYNPNFYSFIDVSDGRISIRRDPVNANLTGKIADTSLYVSTSQLDKKNKPSVNSLYHLKKIKSADQLILRQGNDKTPFIWNQTDLQFYDAKGVATKALPLTKEGLTYIYDFYLADDTIKILGVTNNSQTYLIQYRPSNGKIIKWELEGKGLYSNFRFTSADSFVGFIKDIKTDEIKATSFTIN